MSGGWKGVQPGTQEEGASPHCEGVTVTVSQDRMSPRIKGALSQCPQRHRREGGVTQGSTSLVSLLSDAI